ncbi:MAG: ABC transporter ATP-binding protein [Lachnospiraceae bacterium]|nr:ABC transporter ATP-binding protein [Lachnospiraceae bacterium]
MAEVKLSNVGKAFINRERTARIAAVSDFSLEVADHEFVTVTGPTECGKTTLLRLIMGLDEPDTGEIRIGGTLVKSSGKDRIKRGMVFQSGSLYPHMNVYRNLAFPLRKLHLSKEEKDLRVQEAAKEFHVEDLLELKPKALTPSQKQRVAIARAVISCPDLSVMDEPLSRLDDQEKSRLRAVLIRLRNERKLTVICAASDIAEAMALGDRVVTMKDGKIESVRTPQELAAEFAGQKGA